MVQRVQVLLVDDLDGTDADETVTFGLDGVSYEIDLTAENAEALRNAFSTYVAHARRSGGRKIASARRSSGGSVATGGRKGARPDLTEIRSWARENGYEVSDRGRISAAVMEAYEAAN